jgi:hypothetical protein
MRHAFVFWLIALILYLLAGQIEMPVARTGSDNVEVLLFYPWSDWRLIPEVFFLCTILGYYILFVNRIKVNPVFFTLHFLLNIPAFFRWIYPGFFTDNIDPDTLSGIVQLNKVGIGMMVIALQAFAVYFIYFMHKHVGKTAPLSAQMRAWFW